MHFQKVKLGTIADITTGKSNVVDSLKDGLYPFYDRSDLVKRSNRYLYDVESAIIMPGESSTFLPKMAYGKFDLHQRAYAIFPHNGIYPEYLYYYILYAHDYFKIVSTGSTVASLRLGMFLDMPIQLPTFENQQKIASILSALDKKIALNRQINENLEALARQLYDYWFVQFDFPDANGKPYKSSGGEMVYNPILKREIPEGWENIKLAELVRLEDSKRIPLSTYERENRKGIYPYYGATGIMDYIDDYLFNDEIILLAEDGSTSDEHGFPIVQYVWGKVWVNNHAHIIYPQNPNHKIYTYFMLKLIPVKLIETGSIQKKINQDNLLKYNSIKVPTNILDDFTKIVSPLWRKKMITTEEILSLTRQRDELLPLLMNGQVTVE